MGYRARVRGEKRTLWANGKAACHRRPEVLKIVPVMLTSAPLLHMTVSLRDQFPPGARWMILPPPETRLSAPPPEPLLGLVATCC